MQTLEALYDQYEQHQEKSSLEAKEIDGKLKSSFIKIKKTKDLVDGFLLEMKNYSLQASRHVFVHIDMDGNNKLFI